MHVKLADRDRDVARIVERQMRNWELAQGQRVASHEMRQAEVADFITISREVGAGGGAVAVALGSRLGWPVFDKAILQAMAGNDALRERIYASMDERDLSWCEESVRSLAEPGFVRNDYFHRLCETVLTLARQGPAVFLGRAAELILPDTTGVRVRIIAPLDDRIETVAKRDNIPAADAREAIERVEAERAAFVKRHFQAETGDPLRYDLVLNLGRLSPALAVEVILRTKELLAVQRS